MAFSFAGLKTQVIKATTKFFPNLKLQKGMPEGLKRAVARRFQEVRLLRKFDTSIAYSGLRRLQ
jgi:tRNA A37 threonylcarbamoyltransferase TsaD